jgi:hypothetical protein
MFKTHLPGLKEEVKIEIEDDKVILGGEMTECSSP